MSLLIEDAHAAQLAILYYSRNVRAQEQVERIFPDAVEGYQKDMAERLRDDFVDFFAMLDGEKQRAYITHALERYQFCAQEVAQNAYHKYGGAATAV
jgi:short subunit dehydrogenase-like uncharacterized protein